MSRASGLDRIVAPGGLSVLFQPIVRLADPSRVRGVEALVRGPRGSTLERAPVLFDYVRRKGAEVVVDRACVAAVLSGARCLPEALELAINVHAATLVDDPDFASFLVGGASDHGLRAGRLVVEIVEHSPEWADPRLAAGVKALRRRGVRIALDDIGQRQSNYRMVLECKPDYFKIDGHFVRGCHRDFYRQAVLESIQHLAQRLAGEAVAEGVESAADLAIVKSVGISLAQGHLFSPPATLAALGMSPPVEALATVAEGGDRARSKGDPEMRGI